MQLSSYQYPSLRSSFSTSAVFSTLPMETTCPLTTIAGILITQYAVIFSISVMYSTGTDRPMDLTAALTFSYCSWQDLQPAPRTLIELMLFALDPQKQEVLSYASGAEAQQQPLVALSLGSEAPQQQSGACFSSFFLPKLNNAIFLPPNYTSRNWIALKK